MITRDLAADLQEAATNVRAQIDSKRPGLALVVTIKDPFKLEHLLLDAKRFVEIARELEKKGSRR